MPRSRTWLLAVLVPSTIVLLCLGLTELGLRALAPSARFFVYHPSTVRVFCSRSGLSAAPVCSAIRIRRRNGSPARRGTIQ